MGWNTPDDWGSYYSNCGYCKGRVHASEGGCGCLDDHEQCHGCKNAPRTYTYKDRKTGKLKVGYHYYESEYEREGWHSLDELTEVGDKYFCETCLSCACCDEHHDDLAWCSDGDGLYCPTCMDPEHLHCPKDGTVLDSMAKHTKGAE